jgi:hypothetical protein
MGLGSYAPVENTLPCPDMVQAPGRITRGPSPSCAPFSLSDAQRLVASAQASLQVLNGVLALQPSTSPLALGTVEALATNLRSLDVLLQKPAASSAQRSRRTTLSATSLLKRVVATVSRSASRRGVSLDIDAPSAGEEDLVCVSLSLIVRNLGTIVENLVRSSPRGASWALSCQVVDAEVRIGLVGPMFEDGPLTVPRRRTVTRATPDISSCRMAVRADGGEMSIDHAGATTHVRVMLPRVYG